MNVNIIGKLKQQTMATNTMIYLAVDKDGTEVMYEHIPFKNVNTDGSLFWDSSTSYIEIPTGTIYKLTGIVLTFKEGYLSYVGDNYDPTPNE